MKRCFSILLLVSFLLSLAIHWDWLRPRDCPQPLRLPSHRLSDDVSPRIALLKDQIQQVGRQDSWEGRRLPEDKCDVSKGWQQRVQRQGRALLSLAKSVKPVQLGAKARFIEQERNNYETCVRAVLAQDYTLLTKKEQALRQLKNQLVLKSSKRIQAEKAKASGRVQAQQQQSRISGARRQTEAELEAALKQQSEIDAGAQVQDLLRGAEQELVEARRRVQVEESSLMLAMSSNERAEQERQAKESQLRLLKAQLQAGRQKRAAIVLKYGQNKEFIETKERMLSHINLRLQRLRSVLQLETDSAQQAELQLKIRRLEDDRSSIVQVLSSQYNKVSHYQTQEQSLKLQIAALEDSLSAVSRKIVNLQPLHQALQTAKLRITSLEQRLQAFDATASAAHKEQLFRRRAVLQQREEELRMRLDQLVQDQERVRRRLSASQSQEEPLVAQESNLQQLIGKVSDQLARMAEQVAEDRVAECLKHTALMASLRASESWEQRAALGQLGQAEERLRGTLGEFERRCPS